VAGAAEVLVADVVVLRSEAVGEDSVVDLVVEEEGLYHEVEEVIGVVVDSQEVRQQEEEGVLAAVSVGVEAHETRRVGSVQRRCFCRNTFLIFTCPPLMTPYMTSGFAWEA